MNKMDSSRRRIDFIERSDLEVIEPPKKQSNLSRYFNIRFRPEVEQEKSRATSSASNVKRTLHLKTAENWKITSLHLLKKEIRN